MAKFATAHVKHIILSSFSVIVSSLDSFVIRLSSLCTQTRTEDELEALRGPYHNIPFLLKQLMYSSSRTYCHMTLREHCMCQNAS